jgi:hypothetical protein
MQHPFIHDLSDKTTEEIQKTISDLYGKMNFVARSGNQSMVRQMQMVLESYTAEHQKRMDEMYKKHKLDTQIQISKNDSKN